MNGIRGQKGVNQAAKRIEDLKGLGTLRKRVHDRLVDKRSPETLKRWLRDHLRGGKYYAVVEEVAHEMLVELEQEVPYSTEMTE